MDYRIIYVGTQTIFGILFLVLLFLRHATAKNQRLDKLDALHCLFLVTIVLDAVWILIDGNPELRTWHVALQVVYLTTMAFTGYLWFLYTLDNFPEKSMKLHRYRFVLLVPVRGHGRARGHGHGHVRDCEPALLRENEPVHGRDHVRVRAHAAPRFRLQRFPPLFVLN